MIGWEQANLSLFSTAEQINARVRNFLIHNEWVIEWKLERLRIYTTIDIWKFFEIALA